MGRIPKPQGRWNKFISSVSFWEILIALIMLGQAILIAQYEDEFAKSVEKIQMLIGENPLTDSPQPLSPHWKWALPVLATTFLVIRHGIAFRKEVKEASVEPLVVALEALYAILAGISKQGDHGLRICLFIPINNEEVEQLTDYVGSGAKGGKGRRFSIRSGITGLAVREPGRLYVDRLSRDSRTYIEQMRQDWGFTPEEAAKLQPDRRSWAAVSIGTQEVAAVLYLDSKDAKFFGQKNSVKQKMIGHVCLGIANHVDKRYK